MAFDYEAAEADNDDAVRAVASEMAGTALKPLDPEEIAEREIEREIRLEETRQREQQWRLESERKQAAKAEQEKAEWLIEHRKQEAIRQRERSAEIGRQVRDRTLASLQVHAAGQERRQRELDNTLRQSARQQYSQTLMGELEAMINPPERPPERVVVVEADPEDDTFCGVKVTRPNPRRSWW